MLALAFVGLWLALLYFFEIKIVVEGDINLWHLRVHFKIRTLIPPYKGQGGEFATYHGPPVPPPGDHPGFRQDG